MLQRVLRKAQVDRAVMLGIIGNLWSLVAGPITLVLIATQFAPAVQGYYYTFNSMLALRVFAELGLSSVIVQFASHEWSKLRLDPRGRVVGETDALSRLASIARIAALWYFAAGVLVAGGLGVAGYLFFTHSPDAGVSWAAPWIALCVVSGVNLWLVPPISMLEGCNQVSSVYAFRLVSGVLMNCSIWLSMLFGLGLWTPAIAGTTMLVSTIVFLAWQARHFVAAFLRPLGRSRVAWRSEMWPMQWRIALSWLSGYFISWMFTPVMFHYHGPVVAGQMGMTLSLFYTLSSMAGLWTATKAPQFGMLIAKKQYAELDRLFVRVTTASIAVMVVGAAVLWVAVYVLYALDFGLAARLLPVLPTGVFVIGMVAMQASGPFSVYLRAHKREPFMWLSLVSALLIGLSTWYLGKNLGPLGAAVGHMTVCLFFILPGAVIIWLRCRAAWHADAVK